MDISSSVASKVRQDRELLDLLRNANPDDQINRAILLTLDRPPTPKGTLSQEERVEFMARMKEAGDKAGEAFAGIEGLKVHNLMGYTGNASIGGTAGAVVKALELDCVAEGIIGDRPVIRGASVG